jgi:hypothetical protein
VHIDRIIGILETGHPAVQLLAIDKGNMVPLHFAGIILAALADVFNDGAFWFHDYSPG